MSPAAILRFGYELSVFCRSCRMLRPLDVLPLTLGRKGETPVDRLKFTCQVCGGKGEPFVHGHVEGVGTQRLWPE